MGWDNFNWFWVHAWRLEEYLGYQNNIKTRCENWHPRKQVPRTPEHERVRQAGGQPGGG